MPILFSLLVIIAYLLGSINCAIIVCKLMGLPDPRSEGSNNPGATNVKRIGGTNAAMIVLLGDILKGLIPVLIASILGIKGFHLGLIALAAILGHMYPIFFKFQGGKGVATTLGAILGLSLFLGILVILIWVAVTAFSRYVSLASICAIVAAPILTLILGHKHYFIPLVIIAVLVVYRHCHNIQRLLAGTEAKFEMK